MSTEANTEANAEATPKQTPKPLRSHFLKNMTKNPAFLFYHFDWLRDTSVRMLTDAERGIYVDILCHSYQRGGKLWLKTGEGTPTLNDLSRLLGLEQNKCAQVLANLVRLGCLDIDENGVYFNKRMFHDVQISEARSAAGKRGGIKSSASGESLKNLKQFQDSTEANTEANAEATPKQTPKQTPNLSYSYSISVSDSNLKEKKLQKKEKRNLSPGTMPTTEQEAVDFCAGTGVPEDFIRKFAWPNALVNGFKTAGGNPIAHWPQYCVTYYANWNNKRQMEKQAAKPERKLQYESDRIHLKSL